MNCSAIFHKSFRWLFFLLLFTSFNIQAQEEIVFNETIDWEWSPRAELTYAGNGFYWWHRPNEGPGYITDYGDMPTNDWKTPYDYENGTFYIRFEVLEQPTASQFSVQFGIWQNIGTSTEVVSALATLSGGAGTSVAKSIGSPSNWHQVYATDVDFTRPENFYRIGFILWKGVGACIPMAQGWTNGAMCANSETEQAKFFPMRARVTLVAVASGHTFSGWSNYPTDGTTKPPAPTYAVDYGSEQTDKVVPSTDEYANNSAMTGAASGTGVKLTLTPGQNVYFRTKASGETPASYIQTLSVPSRLAAPTFAYDAVNQRTSTTVSSDYEYSDSPSMSPATSGAGTYVSFPTGTTKYFRKKATSAAFRSNVQTLTGTNPPNYQIDYTNERTSTVVASTDEYSYNQTTWTSGSNAYLTLTAGQTVYFRKKATPADKQTLTVPARPAAPTFAYDATNQRTAVTISNLYEYSSSADMSGATTGSGSYVSFSIGTTRYFRKKATTSAYKSNIQTLTGTATPLGSSEFVILNDVIDWPNTSDTNGFYFFYHNSNMPVNWRSPYNFYNGQIYTRFEIISQATTTPVLFQFGIWQKLPPETGTLYETMGPLSTMSGTGSVVTYNNSPAGWWKLRGEDIDWTQMDKVWHFGINPWKNTSTQIRQENAAAWAERYTYWYPMRVRIIVVAVAQGYTFSGWNTYLTAGGVPDYDIDYQAETTAEAVSVSDEYSFNQSSWTSGENLNLPLEPGVDVYFRKKISPTQIQHLDIPSRDAAPAFEIDFQNEITKTSISSDYQYSTQSNMSSATVGTGVPVSVTPGTTLYINKPGTASKFASAVQALVVPARPAAPQISINYTAETTSAIGSEYTYSTQSNMSGSTAGNGTAIPVVPGSSLYIQKVATSTLFKSAIQHLAVPARPAAPNVGIDYAYETTSVALNSSYLISGNADMSNAFAGNGTKISLMPGTNLFIRLKANGSVSFASAVQSLIVPRRPLLTVAIPAPINVPSVPVSVEFSNSITGLTAGDFNITNGIVDSVTSAHVVYIKPSAVGQVRVSLPANAVNEGNFAAYTIAFNYQLPTSVDPGAKGPAILVYPTQADDHITVQITDFSSPVDYEIYDAKGVLVSKGKLDEPIKSISVSAFSKGFYLVRFMNDAEYYGPFRFIKK